MPSRNPTYNPWWAKVIFEEFCAHYIRMSREQIADDVQESIKALLSRDDSGNSFGARMVGIAKERVSSNREKRGVHGIEGGRPKECGENFLIYGRHANVRLTQEQYTKFCQKVGNLIEATKIIDSLSSRLEEGTIETKSHYATLLRWDDHRKRNDETKETFQEREGRRQSEQLRKYGLIR